MAILLGTRQIQGPSAILSLLGDDPTEILRVPSDACWPAHISVDNEHGTATIYVKWLQIGSKGTISSSDHSRRLKAGEGYVWDSPPRNSILVAISDTASTTLVIDANWSHLSALEPV
jgi:hypothetical protein